MTGGDRAEKVLTKLVAYLNRLGFEKSDPVPFPIRKRRVWLSRRGERFEREMVAIGTVTHDDGTYVDVDFFGVMSKDQALSDDDVDCLAYKGLFQHLFAKGRSPKEILPASIEPELWPDLNTLAVALQQDIDDALTDVYDHLWGQWRRRVKASGR